MTKQDKRIKNLIKKVGVFEEVEILRFEDQVFKKYPELFNFEKKG